MPPNPFRPKLQYRSQHRRSTPRVRCQFHTICARLLFDAFGATEGRKEGGSEREGVDECYVEKD